MRLNPYPVSSTACAPSLYTPLRNFDFDCVQQCVIAPGHCRTAIDTDPSSSIMVGTGNLVGRVVVGGEELESLPIMFVLVHSLANNKVRQQWQDHLRPRAHRTNKVQEGPILVIGLKYHAQRVPWYAWRISTGITATVTRKGRRKEEKYPDKAEAEKLKLELRERKLNEFWQQVNILMRDNPNGMLGNIATLDYRVKPELLPDSLVKLESRNVFGMKMFDELSVLLYDLIDFRRQWENYLKHLKVISLPEFRELTPSRSADFSPVTPTQTAHIEPSPGEEDSISNKLVGIPTDRTCNLNTLIDMRTYSQTLEGIAVEDTSIELILHAIVEQVSHR
ncbi:Sperm-associated antigen 17 [Clonorchis sinensis]|uniref:Sperm-associated antigen 17 n=1 Tax=Clonorchis sinensis TaxID=79923 RepID=A0A8T1MHA2_CLOSI|nr:Sperm-associated antigen 17 [Clonorchis sinensis]